MAHSVYGDSWSDEGSHHGQGVQQVPFKTSNASLKKNPVWMQHFNVPVAHYAAEVHFVVKDNDVVGSQIIGAVGIPVEQLWSGTKLEGTFPVVNESGKPSKSGVGGKVRLYQDAHGGCLPNLRLDHNIQCEQGNCWRWSLGILGYHKHKGPVAGCPREPWHDLHCQIDDPAAYGIFTNFEERWLRASKPHGLQKMTKSHDDSLLIIDRIPDIIGITDVSCLNEDGPEAWHVQNLVCANNLIPMEIALKIANKIREKERFSAYIVSPMWPGGVPTGAPTQRILLWQHNTTQMMYEEIYKALEEVGLEKKYEPQDYLNFFCLGNREARDREDTSDAGNATTKNHSQELTRKNRRFMIYVHSKGMIVDDEYVILASANINQRSLESTRDTEIAMGAYQPHYTWASKHSIPRGQVHGYRMSLWAEHIGALEECFKHPESLECVRRVRSLSELNWKQYAADEVTDMKGHLLKYPVEVDQMGKVKPIPGCETFPDVGGNIIGVLGLLT
ncbi:unnamed protein product [Camellia sinensis]